MKEEALIKKFYSTNPDPNNEINDEDSKKENQDEKNNEENK